MNKSRYKHYSSLIFTSYLLPLAFFFLFISSFLFLASCPGPGTYSEEGTFTINFGSSTGRAAYPPNIPPGANDDPAAPVIDDLRFEVLFTGLNGSKNETFTFIGNVPLRNTVTVGEYNITLKVYLLADDSLYAEGIAIHNPITIVSGPNPDIDVQMHSAGPGGNPSAPTGLRPLPIVNMVVTKNPENNSYEGLPVDLSGLEVLITYVDEVSEVLKLDSENLGEVIFYTRPLPERISSDPTEWWGVGNDLLSGKVPQNYILAEKHQVDYILVLQQNTQYELWAPLRIPGVLSLHEAYFISSLSKHDYYIDEIVDFTGMEMRLHYFTQIGRFGETIFDDISVEPGTLYSLFVPFLPYWDWSINHPLTPEGSPFIRVYIGNDTVDGQPGSFRLVHSSYLINSILE